MKPITEQNEFRLRVLLSTGARSPRELQQLMGISQPTLSRLISRMTAQVLTLGRARAVHYALPRQVRGVGSAFPVYRVDEEGDVHRIGMLSALQGGEYWWEHADEKKGPGRLFDHLPWFIQDLRPDGFVGRAFAQRQSAELGLPPRLVDWNEEDVLIALARRGEDCMGNLIVGEESLARYFQVARKPQPAIAAGNRLREYPRLAEVALAGEPPGSSAGGEQPKFTTLINEERLYPVLVKFSYPTSTREGRRWADLLVCEHLALQTIREAGFSAARTQLLEAGGRFFLEVERFDRTGRLGRLPLVSLAAIDDEFFGRRDNWIAAAGRLEAARMISREDAAALRWLSVFGILISNTDQHFGNVSLIMREEGRFALAPAYDVLPMFYRPAGSEIAARRFELPVPPPGAPLQWENARGWAERFWARGAADERISPEFRQICEENRENLKKTGTGPRLIV
jgi:hypothetical protein